ncbi:MAG: copper-binding protein [Hahellaceae bacterium]|nr:copper-binding protein [Hahellaceae bacterium]MCP5209899.1 copper-binding protein [Hahellaceae bacterium]
MNKLILQPVVLTILGAAMLTAEMTLAGAGATGHQHAEKGPSMEGHAHSMESLSGKPGNANAITRVIEVTADDSMHFSHTPLSVRDGETIKFVVTNKGAITHEFAIGTKDEHAEHGQMMMDNPNMHHAPGGNVITIKPGETEVLIWTFENAWQIEVACNIPGHYQAGMHSPVSIEAE